jgi:hypothetical protein
VETRTAPPGAPTGSVVRAWLSVLGVASVLLVVPSRPSDYLTTFWVLSAQRGYRSRALPGTVLQWLGVDVVTRRLVAWIAVVALLAVLGLLVHLTARAHASRPGWPLLLLGALVVGAPVTLRTLAYELGTFDVLVVLLGLVCLVVLSRPGADTARWAAVGALAGIGTAVHEAFLVLALPVVVAAVVVRELVPGGAAGAPVPWRRLAGAVAVVVAAPVVVAAWVTTAPSMPREELPERLAAVHAASDVDPDEPRVAWPILNHARDLGDEIDHTARKVGERGQLPHVVALLGAVPVLAVAAVVGSAWLPADRRGLLVALWAGVVVAPLLLAPVAHDWGRWMAFAALWGLVSVVWTGAWRGAVEVGGGGADRDPDATVALPWWAAHATVAMVAFALMAPVIGRSGGFHTRVGAPLRLLGLLFGT